MRHPLEKDKEWMNSPSSSEGRFDAHRCEEKEDGLRRLGTGWEYNRVLYHNGAGGEPAIVLCILRGVLRAGGPSLEERERRRKKNIA